MTNGKWKMENENTAELLPDCLSNSGAIRGSLEKFDDSPEKAESLFTLTCKCYRGAGWKLGKFMSSYSEIVILNVDDYSASREAVSGLLQKAGFKVIEAATGNEALRTAAEFHPSVALVDVKLPDLDGYEVCRRLKADAKTASIPVLLMSGYYAEDEHRMRGLESGADCYLVKPVQSEELIAATNALLRMSQAELVLERLQSVNDAALRCLSTDDFLHEMLSRVHEALNMKSIAVLLHNDGGGMILRASVGLGEDLPDGMLILNYGLGDSDKAACGESTMVTDLSGKEINSPILNGNSESFLVVPLLIEGKQIGVIHAAGDERDCFTDDDLLLLQHVAGLIALSIERSRLSEAEKQARWHAEIASRLKDEFLTVVSHELRAPLNAIQGWIRLLREGRLDNDEAERALEIVERRALAQKHIISDLLDGSQIITGKLKLIVQPLDLASIVESAVSVVRPAIDAKSITLEMDLESDDGQVSGDSDRLQQVVWNLLVNAIKFTPAGGRIRVQLRRVGEVMEITVSDSGDGISPEFLPFVFDRFRQADGSSTRPYGGMGLGLAIVRYLVEMHGGAVRVDSPGKGKGATFVIQLPLLTGSSRPCARETASFPENVIC
jgi:signal transduction histidine kinase/DNA-binding response OmpR family regulator